MIQFLEILKEYWKIIVGVLCVIIGFILQRIQKKPVKIVDSVREGILVLLPYFIRVAEDKIGSGNGATKKILVCDLVIEHIKKTFNLSDDIAEGYRSFINMMIQSIFDKLKEVM